ncbi:eukaryotic translation initiation factor 4E transporter-like, partial [Ostrinia furnacalis]|uniref:eukaryotic translation initiation factor 4E transporter-like n=1 Tax=Ostrinia furnacalis TaxID=93504 RepID=UPI00103B6FF6
MSAVNLLSSLKEKPHDESPKDGSKYEGDEECVAASGGGDPAVLAVGPARRPLTYTREQLLRLRNSPLVKAGLETAFAGCEALALVLKRRADSPNEEDKGARGDAPNENHKGVYGRERERRSADPRERVRKEGSPGGGIVLSPQRRSFTSGCGAPAAAAPAAPPHLAARTRPDSPLSAAHAAHAAHAAPPAKPDAGRRIGSGRIMVRDVPASGWEDNEYRDRVAEPYRPPRDRDNRANGDRYDRRSFSRDSYSSDIKRERDDRFNNEKGRDREDNRRSGGRFSQRRFEKEDEPEWFSGGPTSQHDTIELRGFDEPVKKNGATNNKETDKWNNSGGARSPAAERWREPSPAPPAESPNTSNDKDSGVESKAEEPAASNEQPDFNLDEFLKFDTIPDVLTNGTGESEGGSRFSRWFRRESPTNDARHYERLLHNMVDDLDEPVRPTPGTPSAEAHVFAPISPPAHPRPPSLLDLLRQANAHIEPHQGMGVNSGVGSNAGKMQSLEELEARLRPQHPRAHPPPAAPAPADHELAAFKRL